MQRLVTIPEGMPSILVQEKVAATKHLAGAAPLPEEGSVLPDSYGYKRGESRSAVIARMQRLGQAAQSPDLIKALAEAIASLDGKPAAAQWVRQILVTQPSLLGLQILLELSARDVAAHAQHRGRGAGGGPAWPPLSRSPAHCHHRDLTHVLHSFQRHLRV